MANPLLWTPGRTRNPGRSYLEGGLFSLSVPSARGKPKARPVALGNYTVPYR